MSFASALAQTARPRLPEAVLQTCLEADKVVVDNIALVALEFVPGLNIPLATMRKHADTYELSIPITMDHFSIALADLRGIQAHAPARIAGVSLARELNDYALRISVCSETNLVRFTELDVIRLHKRAR